MKRSASCACGCTRGNMISLPAVPGQEYVQCACLECGPMPSPSAPGAALGENRCTITKTDRGYYNWLRRARHVDAGVQEMVHNWLCGDCEEHRRVEAIRAGANKRRRAQVAVIHEPQVDETREMARPPLPAAPTDIPAPRGLLEGVGATPPDAPEGPCLGTIPYSAGSSAAAHG